MKTTFAQTGMTTGEISHGSMSTDHMKINTTSQMSYVVMSDGAMSTGDMSGH